MRYIKVKRRVSCPTYSTAFTTDIPTPDLTMTVATASPDPVAQKGTLTLKVTATNIGTAKTGNNTSG